MSLLLGMYYNWMVVTIKTISILRNVEIILHACLGCTITQDISVVDVKPHFSICLSRDFTTQIVGYISSDCSYIFKNKISNQGFK